MIFDIIVAVILYIECLYLIKWVEKNLGFLPPGGGSRDSRKKGL
jgi:hypothetical protein